MRSPLLLSLLAFAGACLAQDSRPASRPAVPERLRAKGAKPAGFKQLLPKGRIAAVRRPTYVSVKQATIRDDAWVLGVVVEGQARAYSLNLLNRHEIVNDRIGKTAFATVW